MLGPFWNVLARAVTTTTTNKLKVEHNKHAILAVNTALFLERSRGKITRYIRAAETHGGQNQVEADQRTYLSLRPVDHKPSLYLQQARILDHSSKAFYSG